MPLQASTDRFAVGITGLPILSCPTWPIPFWWASTAAAPGLCVHRCHLPGLPLGCDALGPTGDRQIVGFWLGSFPPNSEGMFTGSLPYNLAKCQWPNKSWMSWCTQALDLVVICREGSGMPETGCASTVAGTYNSQIIWLSLVGHTSRQWEPLL